MREKQELIEKKVSEALESLGYELEDKHFSEIEEAGTLFFKKEESVVCITVKEIESYL